MTQKNFGVKRLEVFGTGDSTIESVNGPLIITADPAVFISTDLSVSGVATISEITNESQVSITTDLYVTGITSLQTTTVGNRTTLNYAGVKVIDNFIVDGRANGEWYLPSGYTRQLQPQNGNAITSGVLGVGATRTTDAEVYDYVWDNYDAFDLDGDGIVSYIDAIMLFRYLSDSSNPLRSHFNNVWPYNATRNTDSEIISFITSNLSIYDIDGDGNLGYLYEGFIVVRIFGDATSPSFISQEAYENHNFSNDAFLSPDDGGGAQFRRLRGVGIGTTTLRNNDFALEVVGKTSFANGVGIGTTTLVDSNNILEVVGKTSFANGVGIGTTTLVDSNNILEVYGNVSIADTTSNAGGARYISTEAPTAEVGEEGDIWYDVSSTSDVSGTNGNIPIGGIIMWYGTIANIPASWALCDGTSYSTAIGTIDTPDLRSRFIVGAGTDTQNVWGFNVTTGAQTFTDGQTSVGVGSTGGSVAHKLTVAELASHTHQTTNDVLTYFGGDNGDTDTSGGGDNLPWDGRSDSIDSSGGDDYHENRPPYYALAYIMRIV